MSEACDTTMATLTKDELAQFEAQGWVGDFSLLDADQTRSLVELQHQSASMFSQPADLGSLTSIGELQDRPWYKSLHMHDALAEQIALHPALLGRVSSILGADFIAWGFFVNQRKPSQRHRWHVDVEHFNGDGVTVFIGLEGTQAASSLVVLDGSHRFAMTPQDLQIDSDNEVLRRARECDADQQLSTLPLSPGTFCLMHGRLWHRSHNTSSITRCAAIVQYSAATTSMRVPITWNSPVKWLRGSPAYFRVTENRISRVDVSLACENES